MKSKGGVDMQVRMKENYHAYVVDPHTKGKDVHIKGGKDMHHMKESAPVPQVRVSQGATSGDGDGEQMQM